MMENHKRMSKELLNQLVSSAHHINLKDLELNTADIKKDREDENGLYSTQGTS